MKKTFILGLLMLGLCTNSLQAQEVHATINTPKLTGILKMRVSHYEAQRICENKGMRLPTARELAFVSESLGAQGISETRKYGYSFIKGTDSAGNPDYFYFDNIGYKRPSGDLGNKWFWSSSVLPEHPNLAFRLNGDEGDFNSIYRSYVYDGSAVRCVL